MNQPRLQSVLGFTSSLSIGLGLCVYAHSMSRDTGVETWFKDGEERMYPWPSAGETQAVTKANVRQGDAWAGEAQRQFSGSEDIVLL